MQRRYSGTAGRIENCQLGVFLAYATPEGRPRSRNPAVEGQGYKAPPEDLTSAPPSAFNLAGNHAAPQRGEPRPHLRPVEFRTGEELGAPGHTKAMPAVSCRKIQAPVREIVPTKSVSSR